MAFATTGDVATRLGRALTTAETAMAAQVIELVTGEIALVLGEDAAWAEALTPVPAYFKGLCIDKVLKVGTNPNLVQSISEQLGAHATSKTFPQGVGGVALTPDEIRQVRRVYSGSSFKSLTLETPYSGDSAVFDFDDLDFEPAS